MRQDATLQQDIKNIIEDQTIEWMKFSNKTILVTGASGLIGRQIVMALLDANQVYNLGLKVIALIRDMEKARIVFEQWSDTEALVYLCQDINHEIKTEDAIDFVVHTASITDSKSFVDCPVETICTSINGCRNILELAKEKEIEAGVYLSSMEIYGVVEKNPISEADYGYLDHINVRSSYSESKQMCECLCTSYYSEYEVPFSIARLTQTFGPGVDKKDNRVFAQFARAAMEGRDIVLFSKGETVRNYCYTADAIRAILLLLTKGEAGQAYNISNEETEISIYDMANVMLDEFGNGSQKVVVQIEDASKHGFNPVSTTCISSYKLRQLGWKPHIGLVEAFERMINSMQSIE